MTVDRAWLLGTTAVEPLPETWFFGALVAGFRLVADRSPHPGAYTFYAPSDAFFELAREAYRGTDVRVELARSIP